MTKQYLESLYNLYLVGGFDGYYYQQVDRLNAIYARQQ